MEIASVGLSILAATIHVLNVVVITLVAVIVGWAALFILLCMAEPPKEVPETPKAETE